MDASTRLFGPGRRALTVGLVATVSLGAFEALAVATILPETARELDGLDAYGWAFSGFMLANLVGIPVAGAAADRHGPVLPYLAGVAAFVAGLVLSGVAASMELLVAGRLLQGGGAAALSSVSYVGVARAYPPALQPRMMALLSSAWVAPGLFGPALAAGVAAAAGWRWVFLGLAPAAVVAAVLTLPGLRVLGPPAQAPAPGQGRSVRALVLAASLALTLLGVRAEAPSLALATVVVGGAVALVALRGLLPAGTLRAQPGLPAAIAVLALVCFGFFAVEAFLPLALVELRDTGMAWVAAALTAGTLSWTAGSWLQAREAARRSRRTLLQGGVLLLAVGLAGATLPLHTGVPVFVAVVAWALAGLGIGIAFPVSTVAVLEGAPKGREGETSASMQVAYALAIAIGTGAGGDLVARLGHDDAPSVAGLLAVDLVSLAAVLLAWRLARGVAEPARVAETAAPEGGAPSVPATP